MSGYQQRQKKSRTRTKQTLTETEKRERRKRETKLQKQEKRAAIRAKYGPSGKPAPVVVKRLNEFGEWDEAPPVDQSSLQKKTMTYGETVEAAASRAGFADYATYLQSAHWKALRRRVLERDGWRCRLCHKKKDLQVHHDRYDVDMASDAIWHLKSMCYRCHHRIHDR